jgi:hypothetical protein
MAGVFHRGRSKVAPYEGLTSFLWPTRAKACAMFSWPFGPLSALPALSALSDFATPLAIIRSFEAGFVGRVGVVGCCAVTFS